MCLGHHIKCFVVVVVVLVLVLVIPNIGPKTHEN